MILQNVKVNWVFIAEPNDKGRYAVRVMVPKDTPSAKALLDARDLALKKGIAAEKFTLPQTKAGNFMKGVRDGDEEAETGQQPPLYHGYWFINASSDLQPGVVDENNLPAKPDIIYSGCICHVDIDLFPFYNKKENARGITASINNLMFREHGDRLDGRPASKAANEAFAAFAPDKSDDTFI